MTKRSLLIAALTIALGAPLFAGDVPTFVDLGFSADSAFFMFGQYGIDSRASKPYAELYLVDTRKNDFAPRGVVRKNFDATLEPGQDTSGALFSLYASSLPLVKSYKIDHLKPGRLLYLLDGGELPATLSFRDFKTGTSYDISLAKSVVDKGGGIVSSFGLSIAATDTKGGVRRVTGGSPEVKRAGVSDYIVRRIIMAPDEKTLVLIIEKSLSDKGDSSVRYMVETVRLP
jgi:predicted secreted protein